MPVINPQIIRSASGEELVVLTRPEFEALSSAASDAEEDRDDVNMFDERMAALGVSADARLPPEVTAMILNGDSLLRALRKWKGHTQQYLEFRTDLTQSYISDLESGKKRGTPKTLISIARALEIDPAWLAV